MKGLNTLDLFSGIGGFSLGIEQAGLKIKHHYFSEIDKFATQVYKERFPNARELGSVTDVSYKKINKEIDLLTGGFPCQAFSIAGKRQGFEDTRGTLFFEIARILEDFIKNEKPIPCILLENVKGLLNHDNRRTFAAIYRILTDLNYTIECQLVNTSWWLPQNRERIFIFGRYNGKRSGRKIFPVRKDDGKNDLKGINVVGHSGSGGQKGSIYSPDGISSSLTATDYKQPKQVLTQIGNVDTKGHNSLWGRVYNTEGISSTLNAKGGGLGAKTGLYKVKSVAYRTRTYKGQKGRIEERKDNVSNCLNSQTKDYMVKYNYGQKALNETLEKSNLNKSDVKALDLYNKKAKDISPTLTEPHHNSLRLYDKSRIRKLTPIECERLQGFPDGWTKGQSDTQRYKQLGNAVSVPVIKAIIERIYNGS